MGDAPSETPLPGVRAEVLAANLAALDEVRPDLAERLRLPVDATRVLPAPSGELLYRFRGARLPLAAAPAAEPPAGDRRLVLGVGLGEAVARALGDPRLREVQAWDRDPFLLRLWLARADVSAELRSGRLRLLLGTDLLDADPGAAREPHPLLARVYAEEVRTLDEGACGRRACLCTGGLFVDQLAAALRAEGYALWSLDLEGVAREELVLALERFRPEIVVAVNYTNGLAELCRERGATLVCWEVDPSTSLPRVDPQAGREAHLFTWRRANVEPYRRLGLSRARHLPLAADPDVRRPLAVPPEERARLGGPISFVGSSLVENAAACRARFAAAHGAWRSDGPDAAEALLRGLLARQREDPARWLVSELLDALAPGFRAWALDSGGEDPALLAGELAASEKRLAYVASLAPLGIAVRGDAGWRLAERHGARYLGPARHREELTRVYNASVVNVDVNRVYQGDIVTMRTFDVLACGRLALVEHSDELADLFRVGVEVESYRDRGELLEKARWYLARPERADEIGRRGREAVLARHTVRARLAEMLSKTPSSGRLAA